MTNGYKPKIPIQRKATYNHYDKKYTIHYYTFDNFQKLLKQTFPNMNKVRLYFTRGFTDGEIIYLLTKDNWYARINHEELILHEIGHIEGYEHRWLIPDVMHPFGFFRWSRYHW